MKEKIKRKLSPSTVVGLYILISLVTPSHPLLLSPEYALFWDYNGVNVTFDVVVATTGFIGFGISPAGGMAGADIVIGGVGPDGTPYFMDYHGVGNTFPALDESQDWFLLSATENETHTSLKFTREVESCDVDDLTITMDTLKLIWSWGNTDEIGYHGPIHRGTKLRNLLDPTPTPPDLSQFQVWDMFNTMTIPPSTTTYWCTIHKTPNFTGSHHLVGFDIFLPNDLAARHTHHVDVFRCTAPNPEEVFEPWVGDVGADCYVPNADKPDFLFVANHCDLIELGWAVGGELAMFPNHTGFPFLPNTYFMVETHYDNPQSLPNISYETGARIYYTEDLREYDAGLLLVGSIVNYTHMIPPNSVDFTQVAHCSPWCTSTFPAEGLHVFGFLLHAHTSAIGFKVRLFREGQEAPWIIHDAHYDFNYQQNRMLREEFDLLPGDHVTVECLYDTTWKQGETTIGGRSTREEMCIANFLYYPKMEGLSACNSQLPEKEFLQFLGIEGVELENEWDTDPVVRAPPQLAGQKLTAVVQGLNWTMERREEYQTLHRNSLHEIECFPLYQIRDKAGYPPYPEWQPVDQCAAGGK